MHCHLVTVEVGVVRGTNQRMNTQCRSFNQYRIKRLNTQTVQCRSTVQHNWMPLGHLFQNIPNHRFVTLNHLLGGPDGMDIIATFQVANDKGLKEHQRHFLRQPALMQFQFRPHNNYGTAGIIHTLTQQILTETSLLTLKHIAQ